ncbi:bifunctional folylpolyglutamate synthase/dihydrofolate synthase [Cobetia sp. 3AK]|uniref:bifunctional folylpolyglutamate synthase/dihydrofolate synthase n=1 Tax=Cobetia sp. 3AK TaxID=3040020 RepID=UPI00244CB426|nr:bifunctional folylpolyglutamate synthase/dihydrofolate synthase [Cobetia sp. 3AK]MDH2372308.1 bifunctional folylpolyglutamate synthase/dihydrofolate synthase [Cobetia sp. 3AK]
MAEQANAPGHCSTREVLQSRKRPPLSVAALHEAVPRELSLQDWLSRLERQHPVSIDMGLARVQCVAERLGLVGPGARRIGERVITVAGTNGKGSTVAMLEALGRAHGLTTATYTSPHLLHYNERVTLDGQHASDAELITAFEQVDSARHSDAGDGQGVISLTYFEAGTLAGLWLIAQRQPRLAILEVGLGGRLDAVNIIDCDVAMITTVAQDHAAFLGTDLENIGFEKAGILRAGRPAIFGSDHLPSSCAEHARSLGVTPQVLWQDFVWQDACEQDLASPARSSADGLWRWQRLSDPVMTLEALPDPGLPRDNAASALNALVAAGVALEVSCVRHAMANVQLKGRMQWVQRHGRDWCLDVGHNPHAAGYLASRLAARECSARPRLVLLAMLGDKDARGVIEALSPVVDGFVVATLGGERARQASELAAVVRACQGTVLAECDSVAEAADWLVEHATAGEVLVCGSFFTVGEALAWLDDEDA